MADRSEDWNALFDPTTQVLELRRIAVDHPEFSDQITQHVNWIAEEPPPPPFASAVPVYVVPAMSMRRFPLSTAGKALWLTTGIVWIVVYGGIGLLPVFGFSIMDALFAGESDLGGGITASYVATLGMEGITFLLALVASIIAGRTIARKVGGAATVVIGFLALGLVLLLMPQLFVGVLAVTGYDRVVFLVAAYTAVPVALEVLVGVIAYAISGDRKWHVLWTVPIVLALVFGAVLLGDPLATALGNQTALVLIVVIGIVIRLIVVLLAAAFGRRAEAEIDYNAPAFEAPRY